MTDYKKINPLAVMVFIGEIISQSKFAEKAANQLAKSSDPVDVWGSIQSILVAAANVSRILWPSRKQYMERGKQLQQLLGVDDDNVLFDRTLRNHFEHYDERIEDWFNSNNPVVYMDSSIDPFEPGPLSLPNLYHRSYNPTSRTLSFRDESFDLNAILAALAEIREKCGLFAMP